MVKLSKATTLAISMNKKKVAVVISGYGGNLQALMNACADENYPAKIIAVISNKADAFGLTRAKNAGIPNFVINHKDHKSREEFDAALHNKLVEVGAEIVCLAGFMRLLTADFVNKWQGRMINIHPSLLPEFKGHDAINDALKAGAKQTGCTVHYVTPEMDSGPIIVQRAVDILPFDDLNSLNQKVHMQEHIAYPEALKIVCEKL